MLVEFFGEEAFVFEDLEREGVDVEGVLSPFAGHGAVDLVDLFLDLGDAFFEDLHAGGRGGFVDQLAVVGDLVFDQFALKLCQQGAVELDVDVGVDHVVFVLVLDEFLDRLHEAFAFDLGFVGEEVQDDLAVLLLEPVECLERVVDDLAYNGLGLRGVGMSKTDLQGGGGRIVEQKQVLIVPPEEVVGVERDGFYRRIGIEALEEVDGLTAVVGGEVEIAVQKREHVIGADVNVRHQRVLRPGLGCVGQ